MCKKGKLQLAREDKKTTKIRQFIDNPSNFAPNEYNWVVPDKYDPTMTRRPLG